MITNLPNVITVLRLFAVPLVVWLILSGFYLGAFWTFVAAGVSDAIDGYLARRWNQRTELGAYLDPLADKALLVCIYVTLAFEAAIPVWLAIAVVSRDIMIVGAVILSWLLGKPVIIRPLPVSKLNTLGQIVFAAVTLGTAGHDIDVGFWLHAGALATGVLTVVSAVAYLATWMRHMAEPERPE